MLSSLRYAQPEALNSHLRKLCIVRICTPDSASTNYHLVGMNDEQLVCTTLDHYAIEAAPVTCTECGLLDMGLMP